MSMRGKTVDDPREQRLIELIAEHGHAINCVADDADEPTDQPPFAYSLGAWESYGAPELIIFGLDSQVASDIINNVMAQYAAGRRFVCDVVEEGIAAKGVPVVFLEADPGLAKVYATSADLYYEGEAFPLWQIVWPDRNGRFPWEADYVGNRRWQPDLTNAGPREPAA